MDGSLSRSPLTPTFLTVLVLVAIRKKLEAKGARTIRGLGRMFRLMDSYDGNKKIDKEEFTEGMSRIGLSLSSDQIGGIMALLDTNQDGMLDFNEFLVGMRGLPNERRQAIIDKCFLAFDKDCSGMIEASDLR